MIYRPEIDGLRAISVMAVILFHAGFTVLKGGFVGVDVFFVISGYLITKINENDLRAQRFSILRFYEKRIRRLMPALLAVLLFSIAGSYRLLLPYEYKGFSQSLLGTVSFASNIYFYLKTNYFDVANEVKPLLHTWSLSLEEQFYLIFPLSMMISFRSRIFRVLVVLVGLISLVICICKPPGPETFYLLHTRAWELLSGSLLALSIRKESNSFPRSVLGIILVSISFFLVDEKSAHPGWITIIPVSGTVLVLSSSGENVVNRILSKKTIVFIGLISYSLYLVHQPVFVFARLLKGEPLNGLESAASVIATFALAFGLWKFVEVPFRNKTFSRNKSSFMLLASGFLGVSIISFIGHKNGGFPDRQFSNRPPLFFSSFSQDEKMKQISGTCSTSTLCQIVISDPIAKKVLLIGDSHAIDYVSPFFTFARNAKINAYYNAVGGCSFLTHGQNAECLKSNELFLTAIKSNSIDEIIYVGNFADTKLTHESIQNFHKILAEVKSSKVKFWIFVPRVNFKDSIAEWGASPFVKLDRKQAFEKLNSSWAKFFYSEAAPYVFDERSETCKISMGGCSSIAKDSYLPIYRDNNHLTPWAAEHIFNVFIQQARL